MDRCNCWHFTQYFFICMFDHQNDRGEREEQKELTKKKINKVLFFFPLILQRENDRSGAFCVLKNEIYQF